MAMREDRVLSITSITCIYFGIPALVLSSHSLRRSAPVPLSEDLTNNIKLPSFTDEIDILKISLDEQGRYEK